MHACTYTGEQRGAAIPKTGGTVHGGGLLALHGDQLGVVLPPLPARAPSPPQCLPRRRRKHRQCLLHRKFASLPRPRPLWHRQRYVTLYFFQIHKTFQIL